MVNVLARFTYSITFSPRKKKNTLLCTLASSSKTELQTLAYLLLYDKKMVQKEKEYME